jgi:hypothetical protein
METTEHLIEKKKTMLVLGFLALYWTFRGRKIPYEIGS